MATRSLSDVGHSASVFAGSTWVNRHYLKETDPARLAVLTVPYLERAGYVRSLLNADGVAYIASLAPVFNTSVDRLDQVPQRLQQIFEFPVEKALAQPQLRGEAEAPAARQVIDALAAELASAPRLLDRQTFRGVADRVKQKTGQKGRALFHPIRLALTAAGDGPELDLLVPAMERGAELDASGGVRPIAGARERAQALARLLG
jgi:glutamyl/glutaminyl-tRNA synthetase